MFRSLTLLIKRIVIHHTCEDFNIFKSPTTVNLGHKIIIVHGTYRELYLVNARLWRVVITKLRLKLTTIYRETFQTIATSEVVTRINIDVVEKGGREK